MQLPEICIKRPVLATVLSLIIVLVGMISYTRLAVREYPRIDEPVVSVVTTYRGASAEVVESQITKTLEDSLAGIEGVDIMTSQSRSERSQINVRFNLKRDPDSAAADVRDKVARVRAKLPDTTDEPVIAKVEADAFPVIYISVQAGGRSVLEATDFVKRYVQPRLSVLPGASDVRIFGERQISMRVDIDRTRLAAYKLTVQDVEDAIRRQNAEIAAGRIESSAREFTVVAETDLQTPEQFNNIIVANVGGFPVRLRDVGTAYIGPVDERVISRYNGKPSLNIGVIKQAVANPLDLSNAVRVEVDELNKNLPEGMKLIVAYDTSVFIDRSIKSVFQTIGEAIALVVLVIFFFLRSLLAFATGRTGRLFIEFALTLAGAVIVSGFVALTLSPMMCSLLLKHETKHSGIYNLIEGWIQAMTQGYRRALTWTLHHRYIVVGAWVAVLGAGILLFGQLKSELAPLEDRGVVFGLVAAPQGSTPQYTADMLKPIEAIYASLPESGAYTTISGFPTVVDGNAVLR